MTVDEKRRMLLLVRAVESLYSETCALKTALAANRIPKTSWEPLTKRLMADPETASQGRAKFQKLYDAIERTPEDSEAVEALLKALELPKTHWN